MSYAQQFDGRSSFVAFAEAASRGVVDGFFCPNEVLTSGMEAARSWGLDACRVKGGTLFFRKGVFTQYGYDDRALFVADAAEGLVAARTAVGGVSLGAVRLPTCRLILTCFYPDVPVAMRFFPSSVDESEAMRKIISGIVPGARYRLSDSEFSALFAGVPSGITNVVRNWHAASKEARHRLVALGIIAIAPLVFAIGMLAGVPSWATTLSGIVFIVAFAFFTRSISILRFSASAAADNVSHHLQAGADTSSQRNKPTDF